MSSQSPGFLGLHFPLDSPQLTLCHPMGLRPSSHVVAFVSMHAVPFAVAHILLKVVEMALVPGAQQIFFGGRRAYSNRRIAIGVDWNRRCS